MRILVFSDIHNDKAALSRLMDMEADLYVAAGDLSTFARGLDALAPILARHTEKMWILPGNHEHASQIDVYCERYGFHPLHRKSFTVNGIHLAGLGHSNPTPFNTPGEDSDETLAANLEPFAALRPLALICHCPPLNTPLDEAAPGRHFGSRAVRDFIDNQKPEWFLCGHVHEAAGRDVMLGQTHGVNVGKQGYLLDLGAQHA